MNLKPLPRVKFDTNASKACRNNTEKKLRPDPATGKEKFEVGGNAKEFAGMIGDGKDIITAECTRLGWTGTAQELMIYLLLDDYNTNKKSLILDEHLIKVGLSLKSHKKHHNIFQILYIKHKPNTID